MSRRSKAPGRRSRVERRTALRRQLTLTFWVLTAAGLLARAAELQVQERAEWRAEADRQHRMPSQLAAARGAIVDRNGLPLALSHEAFRVGVAPHELIDSDATAALLEDVLELSDAEATRITTSEQRWVMVPGRFTPAVRESLGGHRGVYLERELRRFYPQGPLGRGLLGAVIDEVGAGGIEQEFEEHLRGTAGAEVVARDSGGRPIPGETWMVRPPRPGGSVVLTLDASLQEIANEALSEAVESTGARGGDLLVTDPKRGEVLAMVSLRDGSSTHVGAINTPYEPGSTLKPFTVASLLRERKASLSDSVDTGDGSWTTYGRTIRDVSAVGVVSIGHALQVSSNVGIAKAAQRLARDEQYEGLRDFGFGLPTGIPLPGEASGVLRRPEAWSAQSAASLAIGYEIAVTPIQMAMAYGALANGGVLMQPLLVRELRDADGRSIEEFHPRALRRVIPEETAREITSALVAVVESGTGTRARMASFAVAGKSGTSRAYAENGGYESGAYFSSFVGFFPADEPQLVVFVKLERPRGAYYGGTTAAPVTRATMEAILAARESPLDRSVLATLAQSQRLSPRAENGRPQRGMTASFTSRTDSPPSAPSIESSPEDRVIGVGPDGRFAMPDVTGLSTRTAARRLHSLGLSVVLESTGSVGGTVPSVGSPIIRGDTVRLLSGARSSTTLPGDRGADE